jgi:hypothetical protein
MHAAGNVLTITAPARRPTRAIPASARWPGVDPCLLLLIGLPLVILSFYRSWIITVPAYLDPWYSLGYFLHLREWVQFTPGYYGSSRIACWLVGAAAYALAPPLAANYVLRLAYWWLAVLSLYFILKQLLGRKTATLAALLLGTYWHFLQEVGWNYVDGTGIAYYLAALLLVTVAARSAYRRTALVAAGACYVAGINTNLFLLTTAPLLVIYYVGLNWGIGKKRWGADLLVFGLGWALALGALNAVYWSLTGSWTAFWSQLEMAWIIYSHQGSTLTMLGYDVPPISQWLPEAHWLKVPIAVFIASLACLAYAVWRPTFRNRTVLLLQALYVVQFLGMVLLQSRGRVLILSWYASYLIPHMFLAIACLLFVVARSLSRSELIGVVLLIVAGLFLLFNLPAGSTLARFCQQITTSIPFAVTVTALLALTLAMLSVVGARRRRLGFAVLLSSCSLLIVNNYGFAAYDAGLWQRKRDSFLAIVRGIETIDAVRGPVRIVRFWYPMDEEPSIFSSLHSVYLWNFTSAGTQYPALNRGPHMELPLTSGTTLVVLSRKGQRFEAAQRVLAEAGMDSKLLHEQRIECGTIAYTITLLRITSRDP